MSRWYRKPTIKGFDSLGYFFWLTEDLACRSQEAKEHLKMNKYDVRFWIQLILIPVAFIITPITCIGARKIQMESMLSGRGVTIRSKRNESIFEAATRNETLQKMP